MSSRGETLRCKSCGAEFSAETFEDASRRLDRHQRLKHEQPQANRIF